MISKTLGGRPAEIKVSPVSFRFSSRSVTSRETFINTLIMKTMLTRDSATVCKGRTITQKATRQDETSPGRQLDFQRTILAPRMNLNSRLPSEPRCSKRTKSTKQITVLETIHQSLPSCLNQPQISSLQCNLKYKKQMAKLACGHLDGQPHAVVPFFCHFSAVSCIATCKRCSPFLRNWKVYSHHLCSGCAVCS